MEYKEFTGKDIAEALTNASVSFGVTSDCISYDVIDKGSTGLLGLGSRSAIIKATVIDVNTDINKKKIQQKIHRMVILIRMKIHLI